MPVSKKECDTIIDSRHVKILSAKKEDLQAAGVVFVWVDENQIGEIDIQQAIEISKVIQTYTDKVSLFIAPKKYGLDVYDATEIRNRSAY